MGFQITTIRERFLASLIGTLEASFDSLPALVLDELGGEALMLDLLAEEA